MKAVVRKPNPTVIGAFVLGAAVLAVGGTAYFGKGRFLSKTSRYVLFFEGSLQGLQVGAPVFLRGVKIGTVTDIVVRFHTDDMHIDIPVYIELEQARVERAGERAAPSVTMMTMIEHGLRAQLVMQSIVTGVLAVQLDFVPGAPENFHGGESRFQEIPTIPSAIEELTRTLENIPIQELVADIRSAVQGVDEFIRSPAMKNAITSIDRTAQSIEKLARGVAAQIEPVAQAWLAMSESARAVLKTADERIVSTEQVLRETLEPIRALANNADQRIGPLVEELATTARTAREALEQARKAFAAVDRTLERDSELHENLLNALQEVTTAARTIGILADFLERHPEALLQGKAFDGGGR